MVAYYKTDLIRKQLFYDFVWIYDMDQHKNKTTPLNLTITEVQINHSKTYMTFIKHKHKIVSFCRSHALTVSDRTSQNQLGAFIPVQGHVI